MFSHRFDPQFTALSLKASTQMEMLSASAEKSTVEIKERCVNSHLEHAKQPI
jgi:hypothetical protein